MSGGSHNYLFAKDASQLSADLYGLTTMADALHACGAKDAAVATEEIIAYIEYSQCQVSARAELLRDVWHALEWWESSDWGKDQFDEALQKWRNR